MAFGSGHSARSLDGKWLRFRVLRNDSKMYVMRCLTRYFDKKKPFRKHDPIIC